MTFPRFSTVTTSCDFDLEGPYAVSRRYTTDLFQRRGANSRLTPALLRFPHRVATFVQTAGKSVDVACYRRLGHGNGKHLSGVGGIKADDSRSACLLHVTQIEGYLTGKPKAVVSMDGYTAFSDSGQSKTICPSALWPSKMPTPRSGAIAPAIMMGKFNKLQTLRAIISGCARRGLRARSSMARH